MFDWLPYTVAPTELAWTVYGVIIFFIILDGLRFWIEKLHQLSEIGRNGRSRLQVSDHVFSESLLALVQSCVVIAGGFAMTQPPVNPSVEITPSGIVITVALLMLETLLGVHTIVARIMWELIVRKTLTARERSGDQAHTRDTQEGR